ncbi:protein phosphatase 2C domain-containing protein [Peribacillus sp. NPDC096540]|uniref:protein phosphatase 2C domain-containing protein n=1 Tax=Peribacillus sp. NPDC096540 TaxID=3390612 RepID=UPI003D029DB8
MEGCFCNNYTEDTQTSGTYKGEEFSWVGSQEDFIDNPNIQNLNQIIVGRYGGNSEAGQNKNEDGCLVWSNKNEDWEFVIILDAHYTAESAEIVIELFKQNKTDMENLLSFSTTNHQMFKNLEEKVLNLFQSDKFLSICRKVKGETSCLIVVRKHKYLWWFSVGDCILYLFHQDLAALGQYQLNQRQFYEWVGQVNTFDNKVPCYTSGTRELRKGLNHILLTTDGLIECSNAPFINPSEVFKVFANCQNEQGTKSLLQEIQENNVRDSTTIVTWEVYISEDASKPSDQ